MQKKLCAFLLSRPVWGAWVEILIESVNTETAKGRAPYGARGLKLEKYRETFGAYASSRPVWGAWVEIPGSGAPYMYD